MQVNNITSARKEPELSLWLTDEGLYFRFYARFAWID